ncbi:MAG: hypothetical protein ACD_87C00024G0001 [uncultured bacterium]|nr:MAG: hypothetical protein ACD_87C00024G0001 [uncultured bacterium]
MKKPMAAAVINRFRTLMLCSKYRFDFMFIYRYSSPKP